MPIYEYKCKKCGKKFDVLQKITDPEVTACDSCHGPVKKLVSLSTFHLKGSGWYVTDYGGKKAPASDSSNNVTQTYSTPSKPETAKPASKTGSKD
jgi:putative FmdB family regulatory protein